MHNVINEDTKGAADSSPNDKLPQADVWQYKMLVPLGKLLAWQIVFYAIIQFLDTPWSRILGRLGELNLESLISTQVIAFIGGLMILHLVFRHKNLSLRRVRLTLLLTGSAILLASLYADYSSARESAARLDYHVMPVLNLAWPFIVAGALVSFDRISRGNPGSTAFETRLRLPFVCLVLCWGATVVADAAQWFPYLWNPGSTGVEEIHILLLITGVLQAVAVGVFAVSGLRALSGVDAGMRKWFDKAFAVFLIYSAWEVIVFPLLCATYMVSLTGHATGNPVLHFIDFAASGTGAGVLRVIGVLVLVSAAWLVIAGISLWKGRDDKAIQDSATH